MAEIEAERHLPMHLAPLLASADSAEALGDELLHDLWRDGIVLFGVASALACLQPSGLAPWTLFRYSVAHAPARDRVRLSRRLHGFRGRPGLLTPPALALGPGVALVPASQHHLVQDLLEEVGATYDALPTWRP